MQLCGKSLHWVYTVVVFTEVLLQSFSSSLQAFEAPGQVYPLQKTIASLPDNRNPVFTYVHLIKLENSTFIVLIILMHTYCNTESYCRLHQTILAISKDHKHGQTLSKLRACLESPIKSGQELKMAPTRAVRFHGIIVVPRYLNEAISVLPRFLCNNYIINIITISSNINDHDSISQPLRQL